MVLNGTRVSAQSGAPVIVQRSFAVRFRLYEASSTAPLGPAAFAGVSITSNVLSSTKVEAVGLLE